jgi:hypothetical protein
MTMSITRLLILGGLSALTACSSSPTEPNGRVAATPAQDEGKKVGIIHPCGQPLGSPYRVCSGRN